MSEPLHLALLGSPRVRLGHQPLTDFATNKAQALLFYLAVTGRPHSRDELATLLWDGMADAQAKKNLRTVLPDLRRLLGDHLQIERQTVAFQPMSAYWLDVTVLRRALSLGPKLTDLAERQAAVDLYQGEFLSGFYVQNAPAFDAWVLEQREQLHTLVVNALNVLVDEHIQAADYVAALAANRRLLGLEPWSEPVHRQQMRLLAQTGERAAALAQYEACQRILAAEFGVAPLVETTTLYAQIRAGEWENGGAGETARAWKRAPIGDGSPKTGQQDNKEIAAPASNNEPRDAGRSTTDNGQTSAATSRVQVAGNDLPQRTKLYGRQAELARVQKWVVEDGCRLVGVFGIGGQGKTALAAALVHNLAETVPPSHPPLLRQAQAPRGGTDAVSSGSRLSAQTGVGFTRIIWQSLLNAPPLAEVLQEWFYVLSDQRVTSLPTSLEQQIGQLLDYLRRQRCLLVLDNVESILQGEGRGGYYRPGYETYGQLLQRLVAGEHRSCLLFTSREWPHDLAHLEEDTPVVRFLPLAGLPTDAGRELMLGRGMAGASADLAALVQHYSGNPLAIKLVTETIQSLFAGNISAFLQADTLVFDNILDLLDQQFARLVPLEFELLAWLAIVREPLSYTILRGLLARPPAGRLVLEALRSLQRRSLLENYGDGFGLQNVVMEYTTALLVENIGRELVEEEWEGWGEATNAPAHSPLSPPPYLPIFLNRYALILAQSKEYVRTSQTRLLLQPVAKHLLAYLGSKGAEQQLQWLLARIRKTMPRAGYAAANLLHLLLQLGVDLSGYDFSHLYFRQLHLRGVSLPGSNFTQAELIDSVFTEPFGLVYTAVFSPDGQYLAAGTSEGAIYLWRTADQQLAHVIQAHSQAVNELAFAQRVTSTGEMQLVLASASDDKRAGFWSLTAGGQAHKHIQLGHEQQDALLAIGLGSDGQGVTSVDSNGHVFVWALNAHADAQLVHHFATTPTRLRLVAYSGDGRTVAVGNRDGTVQLWEVATGKAGPLLAGPTGSIVALAFSADGKMLATGGKEGHLCLWLLPTGQLHQIVETRARTIDAIAFSPDGKLLASTHWDRAVRLWTLDAQAQLQLRHTLLGHTHVIWSVAFGPRSKRYGPDNHPEMHAGGPQLLATGSSDQTVRVWDVETGQALYTLRGQPRALSALAISPRPQAQPAPALDQAADWLLAAVGYTQPVHLWEGRGVQAGAPRRRLGVALGMLYAVAISPNRRLLASGGSDQTIDLWDITSGQLRQTLHGHTNSVLCLAFHPDGALLASGSTDGTVRLWSLHAVEQGEERAVDSRVSSQPLAVLNANQYTVYDLAFSPASPDGAHPGACMLASVGTDRSLRLWDMTQSHYPELVEMRKTVQEEGEQDLFSVAFSPDGTKVACGGNHLIHIWALQGDEAPLSLRQHTTWIMGVAFSPDGATLASSSADCTVCLWNVANGSLRAVGHGHSETVYKVVFSPDGAFVLSCSFDGTIKFWDSQTGECFNTLRVEGPYAGMNITGVTGITEAQKTALKALGAIEKG